MVEAAELAVTPHLANRSLVTLFTACLTSECALPESRFVQDTLKESIRFYYSPI